MASRTDSPTYHFSNKKRKTKKKKEKTNVYVAVAHSSPMAQHVTSLILASEHPALPLMTMVSSLSYSDPVAIFVTQLYIKKKSNHFYSIPIEFGIRMLQFCNFKSIYCWSSYRLFFLLLFFGFWWGFFFFVNYHIELTLSFLLWPSCYLCYPIRRVIIFIQFPLNLGLEC